MTERGGIIFVVYPIYGLMPFMGSILTTYLPLVNAALYSITNGTILHYNGTAWEKCGVNANGWFSGIWGVSEKWNEQNSGTTSWLFAIRGNSKDNIYAVGDYGTILHYDGSK